MGDNEEYLDETISDQEQDIIDEDVDYKQKYEDAIKEVEAERKRRETIAESYKSVHSDLQRTESRLDKQMKVLVESGIAEIDDNLNLVIKKNKEAIADKTNELEDVNKEKKLLKKQYANGDISEEEYDEKRDEIYQRIAELKASKTVEDRLLKQKIEEQENNRIQIQKQTEEERAASLAKLVSKYPEADDVNSPVFKKMNELWQANPNAYKEAGLDPRKSAVLREKLIIEAYSQLSTKPKISQQFSNIKPSPYKQTDQEEVEVNKLLIDYEFNPQFKRDRQKMAEMKEALLHYQRTGEAYL